MCLTVRLAQDAAGSVTLCYFVLFYREFVFVCSRLVYLAMCLFFVESFMPLPSTTEKKVNEFSRHYVSLSLLC